jgi:hypothetical protein
LSEAINHRAGNNTLRLLDSYATTATFDDGDTAWTYDNALVLLAFLAHGAGEDLAAARVLADSLVYAQTHDPEFSDGRLRDAYHAQAFVGADGKVNAAVSGSATGNMAWTVLALVRAWERLGERSYLEAAQRLGQWIFNQAYDTRGAGGYNGGVDAGGNRLTWKATEHNADVYATFMNLYRATDDPTWRQRAMSAKHFLRTMWDEQGGYFWTGTTADGATINPRPIPEDTQSWTLLSLGEPERYKRALDWAESNLFYEVCPACEASNGYRFSNTGSGCWPEGTAHMALAWQAAGDLDRANRLLQSLRSTRVLASETTSKAMPAACGTEAVTGYGWNYPADVPHIGATAWYLFAELGHNPFWGIPSTEAAPWSGVYDPAPQAQRPSVTPAPPDFQKGMSYAAWWQDAYATPLSDQALAELADTGAKWIALIVTGYQETITATQITWTLPRTPTDADLAHAINQAHSLGLKVMLKPHLDLNNDPDRWRGQIGDAFTAEAQWRAWFASYGTFIAHYANLATAEGVEQFCIGTELVGTSHHEADWRAIVADARRRFHGPLVYAANHSGEEMRLTWWDAVDLIGIDAYYPLTSRNNPTLAELKTTWNARAADLQALSARAGKQIILTEIGYRSADGANMAPWDWQQEAPVDLQEQADCYESALEAIWNQPWLAGIYWWNWDTTPNQGGPHDAGFTPHRKPAEELLKIYYRPVLSLYLPAIQAGRTATNTVRSVMTGC